MTLSSGPAVADILIIGDYPEQAAIHNGEAFSDYHTKKYLESACRVAGFLVSATHRTYLFPSYIPPEEKLYAVRKTCPGPGWKHDGDAWIVEKLAAARENLLVRIALIQPKLIICCGEFALYALTGDTSLEKWRGSRLQPVNTPCPVIPTYELSRPLREIECLPIIHADFRRAKAVYEGTQNPAVYDVILRPTFQQVMEVFERIMRRIDAGEFFPLSGDLETRRGHIACFGIAWSPTEAICIPFTLENPDGTGPDFYWSEEEEALILYRLQILFNSPQIEWVGQNYLYDCQYFYRHWGFLPRFVYDTMIGHHSTFSNMKKGLAFLSSLYADDHVFWKDESKDWDPSVGELQYWLYNGKDACITYELAPTLKTLALQHSTPGHTNFQQNLFFPVLRMMNRGLRRDQGAWEKIRAELISLAIEKQEQLDYIVGHHLNPKSPKQLSDFFYTDLGIPGVKNLAGDALTTNSPAMALIANREPALKPLCQLIVELRSIGVFISTFIEAKLDVDSRIRCSFGIAGPETFRFNSRENAFGSGMNLQNIPIEEKKKIESDTYVKLPNIRKLIIPEPGKMFFDMDLDRADAQVVVWEADDQELKLALRENLDLHCVNAVAIFGIKGIPLEELKEDHPNYKEHRGRIGASNRHKAKTGVHATNYGVGDRKLAMSLGITVNEASQFRARWFGAHPGILRWHRRTEEQARTRGYIENRFGARLYTFGRLDLPELLAWTPQSTVAGVINRALYAIDQAHESGTCSAELLIQVHDSLAGQFPISDKAIVVPQLLQLAKIPIPYSDPLIIPASIACSELSWGHCK